MANISSLASQAVWRYLAGAAVLQWTQASARRLQPSGLQHAALKHQGLCPDRIGAQSRTQSQAGLILILWYWAALQHSLAGRDIVLSSAHHYAYSC